MATLQDKIVEHSECAQQVLNFSRSINDLPVEIFLEIVDHIPKNQVVKLRAVCTSWRDKLDGRNWLHRVLCLKRSRGYEESDYASDVEGYISSRLSEWKTHLQHIEIDTDFLVRNNSRQAEVVDLLGLIFENCQELQTLKVQPMHAGFLWCLESLSHQTLTTLHVVDVGWHMLKDVVAILPQVPALKDLRLGIVGEILFAGRDVQEERLADFQARSSSALSLPNLRLIDLQTSGCIETIIFEYDPSDVYETWEIYHKDLIRLLNAAPRLKTLRIVTLPPVIGWFEQKQFNFYANLISTIDITHTELREVHFENISLVSTILPSVRILTLINCCISDHAPTSFQNYRRTLHRCKTEMLWWVFDSKLAVREFNAGGHDDLQTFNAGSCHSMPFPAPNLAILRVRGYTGAAMTGFLEGLRSLRSPLLSLRFLSLDIHGDHQAQEHFLTEADIKLIVAFLPSLTQLSITTRLAITSVSESVETLRSQLKHLTEDPIIRSPPSIFEVG